MLGTALALLAALFNALSAALQQRASHLVDAEERQVAPTGGRTSRYLPVLGQVPRLLRHPVWLAGWTFNVLGTGTQALALHFASVARVQPLLTTQLVFDLPLSSWWSRQWPAPRDWLSAIAVCAGVALFLAVPGAAPADGAEDRPTIGLALVVAAGVVALLVVLAAGRSPNTRAVLIGAGAGICNAATAVLWKMTTTDLTERGIAATAVDWPGYTLAVATALGLLLAQQAYAAGSLPVAVAAMTVTNPVVSTVLGRLTFDVDAPSGPGTLAALAASLLLMSIGAVGLAHSPTVQRAGSRPQR